jgi:NAD(P)-dependent dehydrogenase (short-subunit alcohol dehydrogenase family)
LAPEKPVQIPGPFGTSFTQKHWWKGGNQLSILQGKTLIITGASGGIGSALAIELARSGFNLVLNARREAPLEELASRCKYLGATVNLVSSDAATESAAAKMVNLAMNMGHFHGFVHVAGVLHPGPLLWELDESSFNEIFAASVTAGYQMIRAAVPQLQQQGSGIAVFFGSGAAEMTIRGLGAYSAAKAAEEHLARQLAVEAPSVTSFVYRPGVVDTPMVASAMEAEGGAADELRREFKAYRDRGELLSPEQSARALVRILTENPQRFQGKVASWRDETS